MMLFVINFISIKFMLEDLLVFVFDLLEGFIDI